MHRNRAHQVLTRVWEDALHDHVSIAVANYIPLRDSKQLPDESEGWYFEFRMVCTLAAYALLCFTLLASLTPFIVEVLHQPKVCLG